MPIKIMVPARQQNYLFSVRQCYNLDPWPDCRSLVLRAKETPVSPMAWALIALVSCTNKFGLRDSRLGKNYIYSFASVVHR